MHRHITSGALIALSILASACNREATGQTVAVVNGEEITASELNAELALANVPASADKTAVRTQILQGMINRRLLAQKAREEGVNKAPEFLAKQRRMEEQLLIGMSAERQAGVTKLPTQAAIDTFMTQNAGAFGNRTMLSLQQLQFAAPTNPQAIERIKASHTLEQLAATLKSLNIAFDRGQTEIDSAKLPTQLLKQIDALPAAEPFVIPVGGQLIASVVVDRKPIATAPDASRKAAVEAMRNQGVNEAMEKELKQLRSAAKIEYQPGYAPKQEGAAKAATAKS